MDIILWYSFVNVKCRVCLCCSNKWYYIFNITILSFRDSDEKEKNISEEFYWEYKLILFYLYSWHIFIIKRCLLRFNINVRIILYCIINLLQIFNWALLGEKTRKSCLFDFPQRQTNVFSLSRQATDRQMFKETNGDFSDSITFYWYE